MGIKEWFTHTVEDIDGRFKNPLILSFILVWLYKHWSLVYKVLTFDNRIDVNDRVAQIECYIQKQGWCNMVFNPIIFAFLSLLSFYIIGVVAQLMKLYLGVKLPAYLMAKNDDSTYVLRTKYNSEKNKIKILIADSEKVNNENNTLRIINKELNTNIEKSTNEIFRLGEEKKELSKNILSNEHIKSNFELTSSYLLLEMIKITENKFKSIVFPKEMESNNFKITNGNWDIETKSSYFEKVSSYSTFIYNESLISQTNDVYVGEMVDFRFDKRNKLLNYSIEGKGSPKVSYSLIQVTKDEFIGFTNDKFVRMTRRVDK